MDNPTLSNKYWEWKAEQPVCIGFMGGCDGYLVGQEHEEKCPCYGKPPLTEEDVFKAAYTLGLSQAAELVKSDVIEDGMDSDEVAGKIMELAVNNGG